MIINSSFCEKMSCYARYIFYLTVLQEPPKTDTDAVTIAKVVSFMRTCNFLSAAACFAGSELAAMSRLTVYYTSQSEERLVTFMQVLLAGKFTEIQTSVSQFVCK